TLPAVRISSWQSPFNYNVPGGPRSDCSRANAPQVRTPPPALLCSCCNSALNNEKGQRENFGICCLFVRFRFRRAPIHTPLSQSIQMLQERHEKGAGNITFPTPLAL